MMSRIIKIHKLKIHELWLKGFGVVSCNYINRYECITVQYERHTGYINL